MPTRSETEPAEAPTATPKAPKPVAALRALVRLIECQSRLGGTARDVVLSDAFDRAKQAL